MLSQGADPRIKLDWQAQSWLSYGAFTRGDAACPQVQTTQPGWLVGMASFSEADTRAKLIDPAIHQRGWTEDLIRREETAGAIEISTGGPRRRSKGRVDYVLRIKVTQESQPVAVALIEAKAERLPPTHGLEQVKLYATCKRLNVPYVYASNGHLFVEYDRFTGKTTAPCPIADFPSPSDLRRRYEQSMGFSLAS